MATMSDSKKNDKEIKELISNPSISDKKVLQALTIYTADQFDNEQNLIPLTEEEMLMNLELGELTRKLRPKVVKKLIEYLLTTHGPCNHP